MDTRQRQRSATTPLISVDRIAVRQRDRWLLQGLSWQMNAGEQWAVVGPNGAGKTTLAKAIAGLLPVVQGKIHYHVLNGIPPTQGIAYVASDARRDLWRHERRLDRARDFSGRFDEATTVRRLIDRRAGDRLPPNQREARLADLARQFDLQPLLEKPILSVSTGEMSRILVACELIHRPGLLILDEPFEGLDGTGRQTLVDLLDQLARSGLPILLVTHRQEELLPSISHVLSIDDGRMLSAGPVEDPPRHFIVAGRESHCAENLHQQPRPVQRQDKPAFSAEVLIEMRSVTVRYEETTVLDRLTWTVREGEHWAVTGPNGAGKSTILKLITGDCLQVYANRIRLFGKNRGPDQPLEVVRQRLGVVSHDLATAYQKRMTGLDVVCSGFFDSVGLYRYCSDRQIEIARRWLAQMSIAEFSQTPFNQLSQGQRQMILIARSMVKSPRLLILDEPCSGLDPTNRATVLELVERIGRRRTTGLIFVSHHEQEIPPCTTHHLVLAKGRVVRCGTIEERRALVASAQ